MSQEATRIEIERLMDAYWGISGHNRPEKRPIYSETILKLFTTSMTALLDEAIGKLPMAEQTLPVSLGSTMPWPPIKEVEAYNSAISHVVSVLEQLKKEVTNGSSLSDKTIARVQIDTLEALLPMAEPNSNVVTTSTIRFVIDGCQERIKG